MNIPMARGAAVLETCRKAGGEAPARPHTGGSRAVGVKKYGNCSTEKHQENLSV